ncbi:hypothetical protein [Legionella feeleii]|uniref:Uncharacterized protein n=1 Tax=Legionella feeleii TaxID=453 RepID=A0A0W0THA4_9GAMM|nr:hypothetical protein [Legionella feeleii]KTC94991.1 hypothetical protein Lfee_2655 [Legionella feeleii]SPX61038.1 Uncharacterised protein [Legionella feeleii]
MKQGITKKLGRFIVLLTLLSIDFIYASETPKHTREENKNLLAVFLGGTEIRNYNYFTYGLEYHRTLAIPFGFALNVENTPNNKEQHHEIETMGLLTLSFLKHITIGIGPGIKFEEGSKSKFLGRGAFNYIFKIGSTMEITPNVNYDIVSNAPNEIVYGIKIGKQF